MKFIITLLFGIILVFAQNSLVPTVSLKGISIDLVLLLIVFASLRRPAWQVVLIGGILGFFTDMFTPTFAGASIMGYSLAAFILVNSRETFNLDRPLLHGLAIFIVAILQRIIYLLFSGFYAEGIFIYIITALLTSLFTAIIAVGLDVLIRIVFGKIEISSSSD
ncbi:MAG: rod shape-determining protein MreD [Candidatus Zixiibacteriota bacterium]